MLIYMCKTIYMQQYILCRKGRLVNTCMKLLTFGKYKERLNLSPQSLVMLLVVAVGTAGRITVPYFVHVQGGIMYFSTLFV